MTLRVRVESPGSTRIELGRTLEGVHSSVGGDIVALRLPIARDLVRVGQALFLADRSVRRSRRNPVRNIFVHVDLEEPERWEEHGRELCQLASLVSNDRWRLELGKSPNASQASEVTETDPSSSDVTCVSLFSDGLDSLCGAARAFRDGHRPMFVSHSPPGRTVVRNRLRALKDRLGYSDRPAHHASFRFTSGELPERTRRTRPLLYLSMAGAVALETGAEEIRLNENGVLAVNLPFRSHMIAHAVSRHAHPAVLSGFERVLRRLWIHGGRPRVNNPFRTLTKGEEVGVLEGAEDLLAQTVSCEYARQQVATVKGWLRKRHRKWRPIRECGMCFPCLIRRAALYQAGADDPSGRYAFNAVDIFQQRGSPPAGMPLLGHVLHNVTDLASFVYEIRRLSPAEFVIKYAHELTVLAGPGGVVPRAAETFEIYQRFADEVLAFLEM